METKIKTGILFGGKSAEHEISLRSAKNILEAIDKTRFTLTLIGIDRTGTWRLCPPDLFQTHMGLPDSIDIASSGEILSLCPGGTGGARIYPAGLYPVGVHSGGNQAALIELDVIFPVLHGTCGEDGTIQGLLKLLNIPFVGAGVTGSAVGMDKDVMKRLLRDSDIPIADFICAAISEKETLSYKAISQNLGTTLFIKPVNCGSSVGVGKVKNEQEFHRAIGEAFTYDKRIIIEQAITGREIECSVLGNNELKASMPGEIIPTGDFYSYKAKYIDEKGAILEIPARLPENIIEKIRECAVKACKALCCEGMARVDFFLSEDNRIIVNEINTLPGFTAISMYPKLWDISGITCTDLITELINLAIERYAEEKKIETSLISFE